METETFIKNTSFLMEKSIKLLNFNKLRSNKINPEILYNIYIRYQGKQTYLKNLSNIYVENSHTLIINPIINNNNIKL